MTIKKIIKSMLLLALLVTSFVTFAQQGGQQKTPEERATNQSQWMQQNLSLTSDQNTQVYNALLSSAKQMDAARASGDMRSQMQGIKVSRDKAMQSILTGDQFQKYQQHEQQMMQQRKNRGGGAPGGQN